jgi:putative NIF3 family GTP cyclohydrolase 1 type 2
LQTGKQYIGKKLFWFKKTKILKKKKVRYLGESDWKSYYGSSIALNKDVELLGEGAFKREILHLCKSKGECSYLETKEQIQRDVLLNPDLYYNDWVICRVHRKHILNESSTRKTPPKTRKKA